MNFFDLLTLFGGLAMFLYGMKLMGNSLKENAERGAPQLGQCLTVASPACWVSVPVGRLRSV